MQSVPKISKRQKSPCLPIKETKGSKNSLRYHSYCLSAALFLPISKIPVITGASVRFYFQRSLR